MKSFLDLYNDALASGLAGEAAAAQAKAEFDTQAGEQTSGDTKVAPQASDDAQRLAFEDHMCFPQTDDPAEIEVRRAAWNDPDQRAARSHLRFI